MRVGTAGGAPGTSPLTLIADHTLCVASSTAFVIAVITFAYILVRGDGVDMAERRRKALRAAALTLAGSLLSAGTCLPTWFGMSYEDLGKVLEALGGVFTVMGTTITLKALPDFMNFIRPALQLLKGLGYLIVLLAVGVFIATVPRAATGYMDIEPVGGDKPEKSRQCTRILDFGWCEDAYSLQLTSRSPKNTTYRVNCFTYCGGNTVIRLKLDSRGCPEARAGYEIAGVAPPVSGELKDAEPEVEIKTDGMSPGQELRIQLRRTDARGCPAGIILIAGKLT